MREVTTRNVSLPIFRTLRAEHENYQRKLTLMSPATIFPTVGYVCGLCCFIFFLTIAPLIISKYPSRGLKVRLLRPGVLQAPADTHVTGLLVYVDSNGSLYVDSQPVTPEDLPRALEAEFARRADWSVYVEGDPSTTFQSVVQAMGLVRRAHGKVIMLTPKMRAEGASRIP